MFHMGQIRQKERGETFQGKMPLSVHFFRDAEADALNMEPVSYTHLDVYKRQVKPINARKGQF